MMQKNNFNFLNKKEKNGVTKNKALYIRLSIRYTYHLLYGTPTKVA